MVMWFKNNGTLETDNHVWKCEYKSDLNLFLLILLIVSLYIIMNDEAAILERLNVTVLSFLDIFNIHLVCDKLL